VYKLTDLIVSLFFREYTALQNSNSASKHDARKPKNSKSGNSRA
jgi:hypothetical protein